MIRSLLVSLAFVAVGSASLSDVDRLKAENHLLKVQVLQLQEQLTALQVKLRQIELSQEQGEREHQFSEDVKPAQGSLWNWQTLSFDPPKTVVP